MKNIMRSNIWMFLVLSVLMITTYSCKEEAKKSETSFNDVLEQQANPAATPTQTSPFNSNGASASGVDHYTCPEGHPGAAAAGSCSTCGATLVHNAAFHNQPGGNTATPTPTSPVVNPIANPAQPNVPAGSATNADGVYHYICSAGHAGGAAGAGNCATCGAALVHNADFHK